MLLLSLMGDGMGWLSDHATIIAAVVGAIAAVAVACYTATLTDISAKQTALAEHTFISENQPKISVRGVEWDDRDLSDGAANVRFIYRNEGATNADILEIGTRLAFVAGSRDPSINEFHIELATQTLGPGVGEIGVTHDRFDWNGDLFRLAKGGGGRIYCVGYIHYLDNRKMQHVTGFCRRYDFTSLRWERHADEEYEYAF